MKAVCCPKYGPPGVLQLRELDAPSPKPDEVRVRIFATTVTASDCIVRGAKIPAWHPMGFAMRVALGFGGPRQPILGIVFAGEIDVVGENVQSFKPGDRVFGWDLFPGFGAYAEYKCISEKKTLASMPANASYAEAAAIPFGGLLALHFLKKGNIQSGQKVLIYGASGAVGTSAVQLAKHFGADVTGVCSGGNLALVKSLGADAVIDYTKEDFTKQDGARYDFVFNAVGKAKAKLECKRVLAPNGRYVTVDDGTPKIGPEDLLLLKTLVEAGRLRAVIDKTYPLEEIAAAHAYVDQGHKKGNVIVTV
jgi:NADPH:quinone reductase-like Zn-dependent oxidoreductase